MKKQLKSEANSGNNLRNILIKQHEIIKFMQQDSIKISVPNQSLIRQLLAEIVTNATQLNSMISLFLGKILEQREIIKTFTNNERDKSAYINVTCPKKNRCL